MNKYQNISPSRFSAIKKYISDDDVMSLVVEFGCASGNTLKDLSDYCGSSQVVGFDIAPCVMDGVAIHKADLNRFEFEKYSSLFRDCDLFLLLDVLEHLYDPWHFMSKVSSCLKKGAKVIFTSPNFSSVRMLSAYVSGAMPREESGYFDKTHIYWLNVDSFDEIFDQKYFYLKKNYIFSRNIWLRIFQRLLPSRLCSQFIVCVEKIH